MPITVQAIVLRRFESGDSDRRLIVLTRESGKMTVIAKGARKSASRLGSISDPLSTATMNLAEGKRQWYVTQAQPTRSYRGIRNDYERLTGALALLELYAAVIPQDLPQSEAFDLLDQSLQAIESHPKPLVALVWATVKLMEAEGFLPDFSQCAVSGEPLSGSEVWLSPQAGGAVLDSLSTKLSDRSRSRIEVLWGISKLAERETPPNNLRFAEETMIALHPFWQAIAELNLPANEVFLNEIRTRMAINV